MPPGNLKVGASCQGTNHVIRGMEFSIPPQGASQVVQEVNNPPADAGDVSSIPGLRRYPGGGHGNHSSILAWRSP